MYKFGKRSMINLNTCDPRLIEIALEAIKIIDHTILCGHRNEEAQQDAYHKGLSKLQFPDSEHNELPSRALDAAPYPIDWNDIPRFTLLVGVYKGIAAMKGYKLRCGCDWDGDGDIRDQTFMDFPHMEIID